MNENYSKYRKASKLTPEKIAKRKELAKTGTKFNMIAKVKPASVEQGKSWTHNGKTYSNTRGGLEILGRWDDEKKAYVVPFGHAFINVTLPTETFETLIKTGPHKITWGYETYSFKNKQGEQIEGVKAVVDDINLVDRNDLSQLETWIANEPHFPGFGPAAIKSAYNACKGDPITAALKNPEIVKNFANWTDEQKNEFIPAINKYLADETIKNAPVDNALIHAQQFISEDEYKARTKDTQEKERLIGKDATPFTKDGPSQSEYAKDMIEFFEENNPEEYQTIMKAKADLTPKAIAGIETGFKFARQEVSNEVKNKLMNSAELQGKLESKDRSVAEVFIGHDVLDNITVPQFDMIDKYEMQPGETPIYNRDVVEEHSKAVNKPSDEPEDSDF